MPVDRNAIGALQSFTAAQIAAALGRRPQTVREQLRHVAASGMRIVAGNETSVWTMDQLPKSLLDRLAVEAAKQHCRSIDVLLAMPREQWRPAVSLDKISEEGIQAATKLREALKPWLVQQHDLDMSAAEIEARGIEDYRRVFGNRITSRYWRELFMRTLRRDGGAEEWNRLEVYLPDRLVNKTLARQVISSAVVADFAGLETYIRALKTPENPDKNERVGIWALALKGFQEMVNAGQTKKRASRRVRQFLFARAAFLAPTRDALLIAFKRKVFSLDNAGGDLSALEDGRIANGDRVELPQVDLDRLRQSAAIKNGGRVDTAWREEYRLLSEVTRQRYADSLKAPAKIHKILGRAKIDALAARHQGKLKLRRTIGNIQRDWTGIPSMHSWVVDDWTSNIEIALRNADGLTSLIQPQIIAVMDSASRKFVGWTISTAKAPNAGIVCDAVLEAIKTHGVPKRLGVENGFVFGKSLLVNGKEDEQGRTMVVGLGNFGCIVDHFEKMNPQSKSELEYAFHQVQCLQERHPGYAGRLQILDAPEEFKREQRLIRAGKVEATQFRYSFDEFVVVTNQLILKYNATAQQGRLKGLSPDESFSASLDANDPPIQFTPKLEWMLTNERQRITVGIGGVTFTHRSSGQKITVRGGQLVNLVGEELWALVDRRDASMVTFMSLNFTNPFTMEVCQKPSARESSFAPGSGTLAKERAKIREHERAISNEYNRLKNSFGDPRRELLAEIRKQSSSADVIQNDASATVRRITMIPNKMSDAADQMQKQRGEISHAKEQKTRRTAANKNKARRLDIPAVMVDDDEQSRRALELLGGSSGSARYETENLEEFES